MAEPGADVAPLDQAVVPDEVLDPVAATTDDPRWLTFVRLDRLVRNPRNPKGHVVDEIRAAVARFGFVTPITIDERTGMMGEGHGRAEALAVLYQAGDAPPGGLKVDRDGMWLVPAYRGWASENDAEAEAFLVGSNQLTIAGAWDDRKLLAILNRTELTPLGLLGTGIDAAGVGALRKALAPPVAPSEFPAFGADLATEHTCPRCGYEWSGTAGAKRNGDDPAGGDGG